MITDKILTGRGTKYSECTLVSQGVINVCLHSMLLYCICQLLLLFYQQTSCGLVNSKGSHVNSLFQMLTKFNHILQKDQTLSLECRLSSVVISIQFWTQAWVYSYPLVDSLFISRNRLFCCFWFFFVFIGRHPVLLFFNLLLGNLSICTPYYSCDTEDNFYLALSLSVNSF